MNTPSADKLLLHANNDPFSSVLNSSDPDAPKKVGLRFQKSGDSAASGEEIKVENGVNSNDKVKPKDVFINFAKSSRSGSNSPKNSS